MKYLATIAAVAGLATSAPLGAAATASETPAGAKRDVRCFMLYAAAVNEADKAGNQEARQATGLGVMYFYTKLSIEAPGLNIPLAVQREAKEVFGNPQAREYGEACETELQQRGKELITIGQELQKMGKAGQSSSSS